MNSKPERINICDGMNLNLIRTDKFKSNLLSVYIIIPLMRGEVTKNALLPLVLKRGTRKLNTNLEIQKRLEELYGLDLNIDVSKAGEKQIIRFTIEGPKGSYVDDDGYILESIDLLKSLIFEPYLEEKAFSTRYVMQEKENLKHIIESRVNDKRGYAIMRCIEEMYKNEKFSIYPLGYVEDLGDIDNKILYQHYNKLLARAPMEIFYVGEYDDELADYLIHSFTTERGDVLKLERESILGNIQTKNMVSENMPISQGKLVLGYRAGIPYDSFLYNALILGNDILGGGSNSKLFKNVREEKSLAYYIESKIYKYKSLMIIDGGIDFSNLESTIEIVRKQIEDIKNGIFELEDMEMSKKSIKTSIESIGDSIFLISDFFFSRGLGDDNRTLKEILNDIDRVSKEDIVDAFNKVNLDTIYFLKNRG